MIHNLKKDYYECLAKNILEKYQFHQLGELVMIDKPDLQSSFGIGIEVTRAVFDGFNEKTSYFNKYLEQRNICDVKLEEIKNFTKDGTRILYCDDMIVGYVPPAIWYGIDELKIAYEKKRQKLCSYSNFGSIHLFIFSPSFNDYEESDIKKFVDWIIHSKDNQKNYDVVYIYQENSLFVCDISKNNLMEIKLNKADTHECCVFAQKYAENKEVTL